MRNLLSKKEKHYKQFADSVSRICRKMRYGIDSCRPDLDDDLIEMRKQIVDWQAIEDEGALSQTNINYQNIIEVNSGGCLTRINLNPAITINQNSSFVFTQQTPSTVWDIIHGMNLTPNVRTEDLTGVDIQGMIDIIDNNRVKIYFNQPVAGRAYLS